MSRYAASIIMKIPVGWTMCRVRPRTVLPERSCSGTDRSGVCWRCGDPGYWMAVCEADHGRCLACEMAGLPKVTHKPGSGVCAARKLASGSKNSKDFLNLELLTNQPQWELGSLAVGFTDCHRNRCGRAHHKHAASLITRVTVGWTMCRVRPRILPPVRYFRCQGFGHNSRSCMEPDRTGACWKCGLTDHRMKHCKMPEDRCLACELAGPPKTKHRPGSGACAARRMAAGGKSMVKFLQINPNGDWAAEQLMHQTAEEQDTDILILSEPFTKCGRIDRWCFSTDRKAAVAITQSSSLVHVGQGAGEGFAWATFRDMSVFSCYWRPGTSLQEFVSILGDLEGAIRVCDSSNLVIAGDFNAWNTVWGSRANNPRGCLLSDLAASLGLLLANSGSVLTFVRGTTTSVIDVTFYCGLDLTDWRGLCNDMLDFTYHNFCKFVIFI
ncbi:hypothetical protein AGLY_008789 [Aphis glycines]|uniref:CCHC-type domain-containing protein n=1 Tax=Aphis glycines TaxID=307491 RepID=A0A6G0TJL2_APHGL|nr:hypothetical protein AGLY_008789 [Aphis glycines]